MDTVRGVLLILVLLLGGVVFILFLQTSAMSAQLNNAITESTLTLQFLQAQGVTCSDALPMNFNIISKCIAPLLITKDFKENGFTQPDIKKGMSGVLVIININHVTYNSSNFVFYDNRVKVKEGCAIPGDIGYNVACKFEFDAFCEKGDVLEVYYKTNTTTGQKEVKVFTKNCG